MDLGIELSQKQTQSLILTPEMQQLLHLLQMGRPELDRYVEEALMTNPLLERAEESEKERVLDRLSHRVSRSFAADEDGMDGEDFSFSYDSLWDSLHKQFSLAEEKDKEIRRAAEYIIDSLDEKGYRTERASVISEKLHIPYEKVKKAVSCVQELEPAGVGAKSLEECLLLQLRRLGKDCEAAECIITKHMADLAANRIAVIAKDAGIDTGKAEECCDLIRSLNPKPGAVFGQSSENRYIQPDCFLIEDGASYVLVMNENEGTALQLSPYYLRLRSQAAGDREALDYLTEKMKDAAALIKGIEQRKNTIYKTAQAIVQYQEEFLKKGPAYLRPMTLADIAETIHMHESTVSRAVNGKYIETPRGLFELKYFFGGGPKENISSRYVQSCIRQMVAEEDACHPLPDEEIRCRLLKEKGLDIARRTIAKYRGIMNIPGASGRRRYKKEEETK